MRLLLAVTLIATCVACAGPRQRTVTVYAASSLTEAFTSLGHDFEDRDRAHVTFNFGASSLLAFNVGGGAEADVIATADERSMHTIRSRTRTPEIFARNRLAIVVRRGNPKDIGSLADLARPGLVVVLCQHLVPCGELADQALAHMGVHVASREDNVKAVLTKVELGEADAGIVYVTDITAASSKVDGIPIAGITNPYSIAVLRRSSHQADARAFVDFVRSRDGQRVLEHYGFLPAA